MTIYNLKYLHFKQINQLVTNNNNNKDKEELYITIIINTNIIINK